MNTIPRKILYLVLDLDLGGLQSMVHLLVDRLDRKQYQPYVCCLDRGGMFYDLLTSQGIEGCVLHRQPGPFDLRALLKLYRFIRKNRIGIIHSHNPCALYAGVAGRLAGVPTLIHTDHGRLVPDKQSAVWEDWLASLLFDSFVGVSTELTEYLATHLKIARTRLRTIVNGVDTLQFRPRTKSERAALRAHHNLSPDDPIIGTVCRFDAIKNLPFLIACMTSILERCPRAKLIIVGEGPCRLDLEQLVAALGLMDHVFLWPRRHDIENVMPIFDLYACSSLSEGTSMTILEAMACGVPIIASAVGGNPGLVADEHGVLFPLNDRQNFIDNVVSLLDDAERLERMGKQGRLRAERVYPSSCMAEHYQLLYEHNAAVSKYSHANERALLPKQTFLIHK